MARNNCPYCDSAYAACPGHEAPPPPAEQASGDWGRAANELRRAEALANKSNKIDRHKVIGRAADNNLSAILTALSQRPVVDEDSTELRKVAKRNLRSLIDRLGDDADKRTMLLCLEELS